MDVAEGRAAVVVDSEVEVFEGSRQHDVVAVDELLRRNAFGFGRYRYGDAVLVRAADVYHVLAGEAQVPGVRVRGHIGAGELAHVQGAVRVRQRARYEVAFGHLHSGFGAKFNTEAFAGQTLKEKAGPQPASVGRVGASVVQRFHAAEAGWGHADPGISHAHDDAEHEVAVGIGIFTGEGNPRLAEFLLPATRQERRVRVAVVGVAVRVIVELLDRGDEFLSLKVVVYPEGLEALGASRTRAEAGEAALEWRLNPYERQLFIALDFFQSRLDDFPLLVIDAKDLLHRDGFLFFSRLALLFRELPKILHLFFMAHSAQPLEVGLARHPLRSGAARLHRAGAARESALAGSLR